MRRCSASAQVAEARRRAPGSVPSPRCGPGPPRRAFAASTAAAPDRSALCDFFDSQRGLAPPGRVRGPRAAREGSGALGDAILRNSYTLEASGTRCARRAGGRVDAYTTALSGENSRPKSTTYLVGKKAHSATRDDAAATTLRAPPTASTRAASANPARRHAAILRTETRTVPIFWDVVATAELKRTPFAN